MESVLFWKIKAGIFSDILELIDQWCEGGVWWCEIHTPAFPVGPIHSWLPNFWTRHQFCIVYNSLSGLRSFAMAASSCFPNHAAFPHLAGVESVVGLMLQDIIINSAHVQCCLKRLALVLIAFKPSVWVGIFFTLESLLFEYVPSQMMEEV